MCVCVCPSCCGGINLVTQRPSLLGQSSRMKTGIEVRVRQVVVLVMVRVTM